MGPQISNLPFSKRASKSLSDETSTSLIAIVKAKLGDYLFPGGGGGGGGDTIKQKKIKGYISGMTNYIELKISEYTYLNYHNHQIKFHQNPKT